MMKKMSKKKKGLIIAGAAVVAVALLAALLGGGDAPAISVTTVALEQKPLEESVTLKAPLQGVESIEIVSRLHYKVAQLLVQEGDVVTAGQVLAVLDSEDLRRELEEARTTYELKLAQYDEQLRDAQNAYQRAESERAQAQRTYERNAALYEQGGVSREQLEQAENSLAEAERAVSVFTVANGRVTADVSAQKQVEIARQELRERELELEETEIVSGIDGTVTRVNVKVGRFADDTEDDKPMFVIENMDALQMVVYVSEYDIGKVALGQTAEITADILQGRTVPGVVSRISPTGEQKSPASSERVIPVQIDVTGDKDALIAGITAKAKINIASVPDALVAPLEVVWEDEDGLCWVVRVEADATLHFVPVTLGLENDLEVALYGEELSAGDSLVLAPTAELAEGMAVTAVAVE